MRFLIFHEWGPLNPLTCRFEIVHNWTSNSKSIQICEQYGWEVPIWIWRPDMHNFMLLFKPSRIVRYPSYRRVTITRIILCADSIFYLKDHWNSFYQRIAPPHIVWWLYVVSYYSESLFDDTWIGFFSAFRIPCLQQLGTILKRLIFWVKLL